MFELIRRDNSDGPARDAVRRLDSAAECLHTATLQLDVCSPDLADRITRAFASVNALSEIAKNELAQRQEGRH